MKYLLIALVAFCCTIAANGQSKRLDSLQRVLNSSITDESRLEVLNQLSAGFRPIDFEKALGFALQARELAQTSGHQRHLAKSLLNAGMAQYFQGNHAQALDFYLQSLKIYEGLSDKEGIILVLNELGTLEKKNADIANAELHLARALQLSEELSDSAMIAHSMNNLGHVYELKDNLVTAMKYYKESAVIREKRGDYYGAAFNYDNIGNILSKQRKFDEAKTYFEKEISIFRQLNDRSALAIAINNVGEMYNMKGDFRKAREHLMQALQLSIEIDYKDLRRHIYNVLSDTYKQEGNFQKAFEYFVSGTALKDSIYNQQKSQQLLELQTRYDTEKKENEIRFLRQENQIKDFGLRQNRLFIMGLILVVLGMAIMWYLWQNRTRLKQTVELEATRAALRESQLQAVIGSQESERRRFAADLHDGLGQIISALRLSLSRENPEKGTVDYALNLLNDMNLEIRNIAFNLMPQALMNEGLQPALQEFAARMNHSGKVHIAVTAFSLNEDIPSDHKIALYRVCQEWVNNAIKYSKCKNISIQLVQHSEELVLTIEDDGFGFDTKLLTQGEGNGWKNINSRIGLIKGSIEIDSSPGRQGTTLIVSVPSLTLVL